jgi:hypothetical protein
VTNKTSNILQNLLAAGGLESEKSGLITYTLIGKNCAAALAVLLRGRLPLLAPALNFG